MSSSLLRRAISAGVTPQGRRVRLTSPNHRLSSTQTPQNPVPPRGTHRLLSTVSLVAASATIALTAYTLGVLYPPSVLTILFPRPAPAPPTDLTSPESITYTKSLEDELQSLPLLKTLRARADASEWYEARPYINYPEERRVNNLTAGALRGPGKLAVAPIIRAKKDESEGIAFLHLGRGLCGHDGIIHGGLLATLLDETLARTAINNLPERVGVTANLHINYRAPTRADQFVVIRTTLIEAKGRKTQVSGRIEDLEGNVLAEATGTFVQPRYAKILNTEVLKLAMGEPHHSHAPVQLADGQTLDPPNSKVV